MRRCLFGLVIIGALLCPHFVQAEDKVFVKSKEKPYSGKVSQESAKGVSLGKDIIPAEDIIDVDYEVLPLDPTRLKYYRPAVNAEKDANDPKKFADRKKNLKLAMSNYADALSRLAKDQKFAARNIEYRLCVLQAIQAEEEGQAPTEAIAQLTKFKTSHLDGWQITAALHLLGRLQRDAGQFADAEATFRDLAQANVGEDTKLEALLMEAQVTLRSGKPELAQKKLDTLLGSLAKDSRHAMRAKVIQGECLLAAKKVDDGTKLLRQVIKDSTDKGIKALAYNAIGESLYKADKQKEARWEFLWVDVVYNQDKAEHARALFYLIKIFGNLGEMDRAQECRETLLNDRQFNGLEFQRRAQREEPKMP